MSAVRWARQTELVFNVFGPRQGGGGLPSFRPMIPPARPLDLFHLEVPPFVVAVMRDIERIKRISQWHEW
jgi:hypothetical protein